MKEMFEEYLSAMLEGFFLIGMIKALEMVMRIIYRV